MTILVEQRPSDSPLVDAIMQGQTTSNGSSIRPAENCWHMVFVREHGNVHPLVVGPWTRAGVTSWGGGGEILWIRFKPGVFMPHLPVNELVDRDQHAAGARWQSHERDL